MPTVVETGDTFARVLSPEYVWVRDRGTVATPLTAVRVRLARFEARLGARLDALGEAAQRRHAELLDRLANLARALPGGAAVSQSAAALRVPEERREPAPPPPTTGPIDDMDVARLRRELRRNGVRR